MQMVKGPASLALLCFVSLLWSDDRFACLTRYPSARPSCHLFLLLSWACMGFRSQGHLLVQDNCSRAAPSRLLSCQQERGMGKVWQGADACCYLWKFPRSSDVTPSPTSPCPASLMATPVSVPLQRPGAMEEVENIMGAGGHSWSLPIM